MTTTYPFQRALVTGASSGIGEAIVRELATAGVPVVVIARREDRLKQLHTELEGIEVLSVDLTDHDGLERVAARIGAEDEPIDLVVNNAGFGTSGLFHELDVDRSAREIGLNVTALTRLSHAALATMVPRGSGWLINVSSVTSFQPAPGLAVYAATKAYVTNLTESLHEEAKRSGVHVTALCPGLVRTEFQSVSNADTYATRYPEMAWTAADEVARTALADVVKGKALCVPGMLYKGMVATSGVTPRGLLRRLSGVVQRT
jgi:short-subunit dehydrogenase